MGRRPNFLAGSNGAQPVLHPVIIFVNRMNFFRLNEAGQVVLPIPACGWIKCKKIE